MTDVVDADTFREWMAPKVAGLRDFTAAIALVGEQYGRRPNPESRAMGELAAQRGFSSRSSWDRPITDTHTFGAMSLRAASDCVRGFGELFDSPQPPLYAHLVVARSGLESAVVAEWLNDPGVAPLDRIKRGLCEQFYSASEVDRLKKFYSPSEVDRLKADPEGPEGAAVWEAVGDSFGWRVYRDRNKHIVDDTTRPAVADGIVRLAHSAEGSQVGRGLFSRLSAVTHGTWLGLQWALDLSGVQRDQRAGVATVAIGVNGAKVCTIAFYLVRALRAAATARVTLMGWGDSRWHEAARQAAELEDVFAQVVLADKPA